VISDVSCSMRNNCYTSFSIGKQILTTILELSCAIFEFPDIKSCKQIHALLCLFVLSHCFFASIYQCLSFIMKQRLGIEARLKLLDLPSFQHQHQQKNGIQSFTVNNNITSTFLPSRSFHVAQQGGIRLFRHGMFEPGHR
jgi:glutathione peroxidase-family protein